MVALMSFAAIPKKSWLYCVLKKKKGLRVFVILAFNFPSSIAA